MRYSIKIDVWKFGNKYGKPDETKTVGDYYTQEAAEVDMKTIEFRLMYAGYDKIRLEVIEIQDG
jgi:hypothetical protein